MVKSFKDDDDNFLWEGIVEGMKDRQPRWDVCKSREKGGFIIGNFVAKSFFSGELTLWIPIGRVFVSCCSKRGIWFP